MKHTKVFPYEGSSPSAMLRIYKLYVQSTFVQRCTKVLSYFRKYENTKVLSYLLARQSHVY